MLLDFFDICDSFRNPKFPLQSWVHLALVVFDLSERINWIISSFPQWISKILFVLGNWDHFGSLRCRIEECPFRYGLVLFLGSVLSFCLFKDFKRGLLTGYAKCRILLMNAVWHFLKCFNCINFQFWISIAITKVFW